MTSHPVSDSGSGALGRHRDETSRTTDARPPVAGAPPNRQRPSAISPPPSPLSPFWAAAQERGHRDTSSAPPRPAVPAAAASCMLACARLQETGGVTCARAREAGGRAAHGGERAHALAGSSAGERAQQRGAGPGGAGGGVVVQQNISQGLQHCDGACRSALPGRVCNKGGPRMDGRVGGQEHLIALQRRVVRLGSPRRHRTSSSNSVSSSHSRFVRARHFRYQAACRAGHVARAASPRLRSTCWSMLPCSLTQPHNRRQGDHAGHFSGTPSIFVVLAHARCSFRGP